MSIVCNIKETWNKGFIDKCTCIFLCFVVAICAGCQSAMSRQEEGYVYVLMPFESDTGQEWHGYDQVLKSGRNASPPKPIYIAASDIEVRNGVVISHVQDPRLKVGALCVTNLYGVVSSCYYESREFGKFRLDVLCNEKDASLNLTLFRQNGASEVRICGQEWRWSPLDDGVVYEKDSVKSNQLDKVGLTLFFRLLGDCEGLRNDDGR